MKKDNRPRLELLLQLLGRNSPRRASQLLITGTLVLVSTAIGCSSDEEGNKEDTCPAGSETHNQGEQCPPGSRCWRWSDILTCKTSCADLSGGCPEKCPGGDLISSEDDCLADATCFELDDGNWCTGDDVCPMGELVDSSDDCASEADCLQLATGFWCSFNEEIACPDGTEPHELGENCQAGFACWTLTDDVSCRSMCSADDPCE